ncbi:MAG: WG repeat-containing protein [Pseudomonadota bacterium]
MPFSIQSHPAAGVTLLVAGLALPAPAMADERCKRPDCFLDAVALCEPAVFETDEVDALAARGRYRVLGPTEYACRLEFTYSENPNPAYVDKPMTFVIDPSTASQDVLKDVVAACLMGGEEWYQCEGPLIEEVSGRAADPEALADGSGPLPCGRSVELEGPALYPMPKDGKWGYLDHKGDWQIAPRWERAGDFHEGRAMVGSASGWGIIDREGNEIVAPQFKGDSFVTLGDRNWYDSPFSPYSEGCSVMTHFTDETQPSFFVDRDGRAHWRDSNRPEPLQERDIQRFGVFSQGLAWFREGFGEDARFGWVDARGAIAIEPEFIQAGRFSEDLAFAAARAGQGAFISPEGDPVLPRKWLMHSGGPFSEGLARTNLEGTDMAYWDTSDVAFEEVVFEAPGDDRPARAEISREAGDFHDGRAPVITGFQAGDELVYVRPDGTAAFIPDEIKGIRVCNRRALPEFHGGLVRLLVADDGETCDDKGYTYGLAHYEDAHYVYLDTVGQVVLRQEK